ncbi:putative NADP-dependent oxidoreductase YfmJ [Beauveria bassiana]|uniref:Dehydrogenase FUB6 n=1 Tax=Beauveria bassiana TaxID=176275 RepID=A0A2N6NLU2_BEABA|nr:putative NADP-dependent oxidoreductase YfmJ [Beauveria bassiana]
MPVDNLQIVLAERPKDEIIPGQTFHQRVTPAPTEADLADGDVLVEVLYVSLDPAMRGWLNDDRSYLPPVEIGAVMRAGGACRVLASKDPSVKPGDLVSGLPGWQQYAVLKAGWYEPQSKFPRLRDAKHIISVFGLTGMTAWVGMTQIGDPKPGELVVVSGAAGATGSVAGQVAKARGARVVGIAGSDDKCRWLVDDLGFDQALNYKDPEFKKKFLEATKDHIDVYFDNVGGEVLDLALRQAKEFSRFVMCGAISQYNTSQPVGPRNITRVIQMRIRMQGFIVFDHQDKYPEARADLARLLDEGKLKTSIHLLKGGLQVAEQGLVDLYKGVNTGKLIVELKNPDESPAKL